jgi:uncharacterized peroxidase-related enzyme
MTFIDTISPSTAEGPVREMYEKVRAEQGHIPNWAQAFSLRPAVRAGWVSLIGAIRPNLSVRRYELATLAAARALRSSYCSLAHGRVLAEKVFDAATVASVARGDDTAHLEPSELVMMAFVEKIVRNADRVTQTDISQLRKAGYSDEEIFDIAATAAARCFFSKLLDALGVEADAHFNDLDPALRDALMVGRPVSPSVA